jgi:hypothetical protein
LWIRPGAYPRVKHPKGVSLGQAMALLANIRLGWKVLPFTYTLAYYDYWYITVSNNMTYNK